MHSNRGGIEVTLVVAVAVFGLCDIAQPALAGDRWVI